MFKIKTFIINLEERTDRLANILQEFSGKDEFDITIIPAIKSEVGAIGLWKTIRYIFETFVDNEPYVLICEDDHVFTPAYNINDLKVHIDRMSAQNADILLGGVSWFLGAVPLERNYFWLHYFNGLQFSVVFKKFYYRILETKYFVDEAADLKISSLSINKYCIYPFISIQKDFGYSDATGDEKVINNVENMFKDAGDRLAKIKLIGDYYNS